MVNKASPDELQEKAAAIRLRAEKLENRLEAKLRKQGADTEEIRDAIAENSQIAKLRGQEYQLIKKAGYLEMDEEDQTEDIKALDSFLNPQAPATEEEEAGEEEEEGKKKQGKPDKAVEAAKGRSFTAGLKARAAKLPTPGSIAFPLLAVLVMIFFVTPVGGKTRAVHLWNVLIGKEALSDEAFASNQPTAGAGSGQYQDNVIQFNPKATQFTMIEEGSV